MGQGGENIILALALFVFLLILGSVLISGHGSMIIAGYNTLPKEERQKYDEKRLGVAVGALVMIVDVILVSSSIAADMGIKESSLLGIVLILLSIIVLSFYVNTSDKFKKKS